MLCSSGGEWTVLSEEVTDSCYVVKDLPRGASYVFRVGCITKTGAGPFSDTSSPVVMATHPEGKKNALKHCVISSIYCSYVIILQREPLHGGLYCFTFFLLYRCTETHIPLIQTESLGSKVVKSQQQTTQHTYNFLSEINRCDFN